MDIILNYIFIGFVFIFFIDWLLNIDRIKKHPLMVNQTWGWSERTICILIWPLAILVFLVSFFKTYFD